MIGFRPLRSRGVAGTQVWPDDEVTSRQGVGR